MRQQQKKIIYHHNKEQVMLGKIKSFCADANWQKQRIIFFLYTQLDCFVWIIAEIQVKNKKAVGYLSFIKRVGISRALHRILSVFMNTEKIDTRQPRLLDYQHPVQP